MLKKKTINIVLDSAQHTWKKRPSEIRGYQRTYYITTEDGDYLRLDYSLKEKRVRLYMEIDSEGGNAYYWAPEIMEAIQNKEPAYFTQQSDMWALGLRIREELRKERNLPQEKNDTHPAKCDRKRTRTGHSRL